MNIMETVRFLRTNDNYLILTHARPDGDTMGSAAALCHILRKLGKTAYVYNNPQFSDNYPWITEPYLAPEDFKERYVISVDIATDDLFPKGFKGVVDYCIDHHPSNTGYATKRLLMPEKASCGEIILSLVKPISVEMDKTIADLLYIAVSTDTGCFVYGNTTADTLRAAAELCDAGASNTILNKVLFRTSTKERIKLEGMVFSSLQFLHDGETVMAVVTLDMLRESGATESDCADLAGLPGRVQGGGVSVLVRENGNESCKISVRTNGLVNANDICKRFGGGGHDMAAGCAISKGVEETVKLLADAIAEARQ